MKKKYSVKGGSSEHLVLWENPSWALLDVAGEPCLYPKSQLKEVVQHFTGKEIEETLVRFMDDYGPIDNANDVETFMDVLFS